MVEALKLEHCNHDALIGTPKLYTLNPNLNLHPQPQTMKLVFSFDPTRDLVSKVMSRIGLIKGILKGIYKGSMEEDYGT